MSDAGSRGATEATDKRWIAVVSALALVGLTFRTQALIIGPLVGEVQDDLGMSHAVAGLLGTAAPAELGGRLAEILAARLGHA